MKQSQKYKKMFSEAVDYQNEYLKTITQAEKLKVEKIIESFINAEDQMLVDTFVNAVRYAYKLFLEL